MIIMNKLYKCALGLLTAFILSFACFSSAEDVGDLINFISEGNVNIQTSWTDVVKLNGNHELNSICVFFTSNDSTYEISIGLTSTSSSQPYRSYVYSVNNSQYVCLDNRNDYYLVAKVNRSGTFGYKVFSLNGLLSTNIPKLTSLQCQTEYNLIPISEVTANYCALNFGMIDPQECPVNEGTGAIVRSNLMINDIPYAQNQNINVFIPDFLAWNIAFNDFNTVIEVEGYNADEEYIEKVINQEKLTPTNKDIENMLTGFMTNYFPYLALAIVFLYLARKIFKLFK